MQCLIRFLVILFVSVLAGSVFAQLVNENILIVVPPGYKIDFQDRKPRMLMNEMVPQGETVNNWTEMVTVQIFCNLKTTPDQFVSKLASGWTASCSGASGLTSNAPENDTRQEFGS